MCTLSYVVSQTSPWRRVGPSTHLAVFCSHVVGVPLVAPLQGLSIETEEFQSKMDALNQFMIKYKIPQHLRVRANDFCFYAHSSKCVSVCQHSSVRLCVRSCVRACVRACVRTTCKVPGSIHDMHAVGWCTHHSVGERQGGMFCSWRVVAVLRASFS